MHSIRAARLLIPLVMSAAAGGCGDSKGGTGADAAAGGGGMVMVPAGAFMRGCNGSIDTGCNPDENPYRRIELGAFSIDVSEVTNGMFLRCREAGACSGGPATISAANESEPVANSDWATAVAYCTWAGKRLPTEAEWEKAARGTDGRRYPWGNDEPTCERANLGKCGQVVARAGERPSGASPYGALDMAGNLMEWVADDYDAGYYAVAPERDPGGPQNGGSKLLRGGAFVGSDVSARTSNRYPNPPAEPLRFGGFRCAR
jgi:formylglycine-generating enzyme required for sulfatase activity